MMSHSLSFFPIEPLSFAVVISSSGCLLEALGRSSDRGASDAG